METINVRYGATLNLRIESDDLTATDATLYVGKAGEGHLIASAATFDELGVAEIQLTASDTQIPLGEYSYQITVLSSTGGVEKYPTAEECEDGHLPKFIVHEALDEVEVS